jgi:voltage-gated potassium channel
MNGITKHPRSSPQKLDATRAALEFLRTLWHLRTLYGLLLIVFMALSVATFRFGGLLNTLTHARVAFGETLYYCSVTALTIGYGDIVPTTAIGRFAAVVLGMLGVLVTGLTTSAAVFAVQRAAGRAT